MGKLLGKGGVDFRPPPLFGGGGQIHKKDLRG